jgi:PAS domain S-box-containing protein
MPINPIGSATMFFTAIPWVLVAGMLGPFPAALVAGFSGLFLSLWGTHNIFTPLELALAGILYSVATRQQYRTMVFSILHHPIAIGILESLLYPVLYFFGASMVVSGNLAVRLDFAITHLQGSSLSFAIPLILASLFAEIYSISFPSLWDGRVTLQPSPVEKRLESRYLYTLGPLVIIMDLVLVISAWKNAERTSRQMIEDRLANMAQVTSEQIPYFLTAGQNLVFQLAGDPRLYNPGNSSLNTVLMDDFRTIPFFTHLYLLDADMKPIAGYPDVYDFSRTLPKEQSGIQRALDGIPFQTYIAPPEEGQNAAQISFVAAVFDPERTVRAVLIGRTDLARNPYSGPVLSSLDTLQQIGGVGMLLDDEGRILYHPLPSMILKEYSSDQAYQINKLTDEIGPDGTRQLVYYKPLYGGTWMVVLQVPAQQAQQLAVTIATPLSIMVLVLSAVLALYLHSSMRKVTASLQKISSQATRISQGELNQAMQIQGEDEVAQLGRAFEQMRTSLKESLDEQQRLLRVSQGVASSLEMNESVQPVLESILANGASSARIVLSPEALPEFDGNGHLPVVYAAGSGAKNYAYLDEQVITLMRQQTRLVLTRPRRTKLFNYPPNASIPEALLALPIHHENQFYGSLWAAYDQPHVFSEDEVRFHTTLAGQAALAAANSRNYLNAEIGRQRLAAILASTLDPVLVTDQNERLVLANPAAWQTLGLGTNWIEGKVINTVVSQPELVELLSSQGSTSHTHEITLADGKVYSATASTVLAEGKPVGRVCVLRDITYFKELDTLKSDFVNTVSHDLRSPLTLMRGYATMLEMVGQLNEQQVGYVHKILHSVKDMSQLVNNLLDLGRIEAGMALNLKLIPVQELLERIVSGLQLLAAQRRLQLSLDIPDHSLPLLEADQDLLQQALHNLVENAIKFTEAEGQVQVRVKTNQDNMIFEVSDTGIGIAHVDQPHVFEKFYQIAHTRGDQEKGSGLGLTIVKSIAERHGGEVTLTSQLGKGSTFILSIPLKQTYVNNGGLKH